MSHPRAPHPKSEKDAFRPGRNDLGALLTAVFIAAVAPCHGARAADTVMQSGPGPQESVAKSPPFTAELTCRQSLGVEGCDPSGWLALTLSEPTPPYGALPSLLGNSGKRYPAKWFDHNNPGVWGLRFPGPFVPGESVTLELPPSFGAIDGRAIWQVAPLLKPVRIAALTPYVGMAKQKGVLTWRPGAQTSWPVLARASGPLTVRSWQFGRGQAATADMLRVINRTTPSQFQNINLEQLFGMSKYLLADVKTRSTMQEQTVAVDHAGLAYVGIPMSGYGLRLVEADSPAFLQTRIKQKADIFKAGLGRMVGKIDVDADGNMRWDLQQIADMHALRSTLTEKMQGIAPHDRTVGLRIAPSADPSLGARITALGEQLGVKTKVGELYADGATKHLDPAWRETRAAVVQLTNLNVTARLTQRGRSLVWVSALDSGKPVAGARVEVWSSAYKRVLQGHSDASGRFLFAPPPLSKDEARFDQSWRYGWIVVRKGGDMAILRTDWNDPMHAQRNTVPAPPARDMLAHTIVDRVLLRAGDTLSMQHLLRAATGTGWARPEPAHLARASSLHIYKVYEPAPLARQVLHWSPDGSAYSQWTIPTDASPGIYRYELHGNTAKLSGGTVEVIGAHAGTMADPGQSLPLQAAGSGRAILERRGARGLHLRPPFLPATLLLTVEHDDVLASEVHMLTKPEHLLELPFSGHVPAIDVTARFVRGSDQVKPGANGDARLSHSARLAMALPENTGHPHQLTVNVTPDKEVFAAGAPATVHIKVRRSATGRAAPDARLTLIVADDDLLALKPNPSWEIAHAFWPHWRTTGDLQQAGLDSLWTLPFRPGMRADDAPRSDRILRTYDLAHATVPERTRLTDEEPELPRIMFSVTPAAGPAMPERMPPAPQLQGAPPIMRGETARTSIGAPALWRTGITLDSNGTATVTFPLPGSATRWRVTVLAFEGGDAVGKGEAVLLPLTLAPDAR